MGGWLGDLVVGKSDFNENPVVSLELDLDFGLRLRVCQFLLVLMKTKNSIKNIIWPAPKSGPVL